MSDEPAPPLDTGRRGWKTQAKVRCRAIVAATPDGHVVTGDDALFVAWLLDRHPCAGEKTGPGVAGFTTQTTEMGTRGFVVHRTDGTSTDFSYYACITAPDHPAIVRSAMRRAIAGQVIEFKQAAQDQGPLVCAVTGVPLSREAAHVDHAPPVFTALADEWAAAAGGYAAVVLSRSADGQIGRRLSPADEASWTEFHRARARLRITSRLANLSLLRTGRAGQEAGPRT
ncbi:MAG TPA: DCL family protein [Streptosporangiaceae bacterium]|nr:DCL family protein [Streptosporangiaceae bacterium]